jgi:RNA polymerase sigma-70 factor (ECF subfamily)
MRFHSFNALYLERLRSGDPGIEQHFVQYFTTLIQLKLRRRLSSPSVIEDIRQETFARVWAALRRNQGIRQPKSLGSFVNSVCNNVVFEHYRQALKEVPSGDDVQISVADPATSCADAISDGRMREKVRDIIHRLPDKDRLLLEQVFLNECDKDEVCRDVGVSREYLRVLLHRSRRSFKRLFLKETERLAEARFPPGRIFSGERDTAVGPLTPSQTKYCEN